MMLFIIAMLLSQLPTAQIETRLLAGELARKDLIVFAQLANPDPGDAWNVEKCRYQWKPHHLLVGDALQDVADGKLNRLEIELPARHGKSTLSVIHFVPWYMGRFPGRSVIVVTHTDQLAREHGRACRDIFRSPGYRLTFGADPNTALRDDTQAADRLQLVGGGVVTFSGRGGLGAGVGADLMVFDDFFKNSEEAQSPTVRDAAWGTYIKDCQSRLNNDLAPVVMIGTRRHEDDVQGRLFDKSNLHFDPKEAKRWKRIRLPALAEDHDPLGRAKDEPLWPEKFGFTFYDNRRNSPSEVVRMDFQTQDQCNPIPEDGDYFKANWIKTYKRDELPQHLRHFSSSDHALRKGKKNDRSCLLCAAIDPVGRIFILPETKWDRLAPDEMVEAMIDLMAALQPEMWWAARDSISGSIEPFLKVRMRERGVYRPYDDSISEGTDLEQRARSIQARMAMGMVYFPEEWPQWGDAEAELLAFPNGKHDDFIAALAMLGMGMDRMFPAAGPGAPPAGPKPGTLAWVKQDTELTDQERRAKKANAGW